MEKNNYSRRNFLGKGLMATALAASLPSLAQAALPRLWDGEDPKAPAKKPGEDPKAPKPKVTQVPKSAEPPKAPPGPLPEPEKKLKTVLLVGSYQSKALEDRVQQLLEGKACVYTPSLNCGNTLDVMRNMQQWLKDYDPDVVHITTGHEDMRSIFYGSYENMVPRAFYKRNLRQILDFVYGISDRAVPIWATAVPVQDEWLASDKSRVRDWTFFTNDVDIYNKEALKVCKKMKVNVNDLYSVINYSGIEGMMHPNGYELNGKGLAAIASATANRIENFL